MSSDHGALHLQNGLLFFSLTSTSSTLCPLSLVYTFYAHSFSTFIIFQQPWHKKINHSGPVTSWSKTQHSILTSLGVTLESIKPFLMLFRGENRGAKTPMMTTMTM